MAIKKWIFDNLFADYKEGYELQIDNITKMFEGLEARLKEMEKLPEEVQKQKELEDSLNNKYPKKVITYNGRYIPKYGQVKIDVRGFFINPVCSEMLNIVKPWLKLPDDQKAFKCLEWVINFISYVPDKENTGLNEFWFMPQETLMTRRGDCDDGSILLANFMLSVGIPYWKIRIVASDTIAGGHCWVSYYFEEKNRWVTLDWCFFPVNHSIKARPDYKNDKNYGNIWFSFNEKCAFSKELG